MQAREEKAKTTGRKPGGKPPEPPSAEPGPKDQVNLTDEESRIMPVARRRLRSGLQVKPMLDKLDRLGKTLGATETLLPTTATSARRT